VPTVSAKHVLTAASGVLGAASNRVVIDDTVLVEPMTVAVVDGELWPVEEPTVQWCTQDASIAIDRNLRSATVTTTGMVRARRPRVGGLVDRLCAQRALPRPHRWVHGDR
jgi:hypothetical protein